MSLFKLTFEIKILQQNPDSVGFKSEIGIRAARPVPIFFIPDRDGSDFFKPECRPLVQIMGSIVVFEKFVNR